MYEFLGKITSSVMGYRPPHPSSHTSSDFIVQQVYNVPTQERNNDNALSYDASSNQTTCDPTTQQNSNTQKVLNQLNQSEDSDNLDSKIIVSENNEIGIHDIEEMQPNNLDILCDVATKYTSNNQHLWSPEPSDHKDMITPLFPSAPKLDPIVVPPCRDIPYLSLDDDATCDKEPDSLEKITLTPSLQFTNKEKLQLPVVPNLSLSKMDVVQDNSKHNPPKSRKNNFKKIFVHRRIVPIRQAAINANHMFRRLFVNKQV
jgi:hypothetical protein